MWCIWIKFIISIYLLVSIQAISWEEANAALYLKKYGYLKHDSFVIPSIIDKDILKEAVSKFQKFAQINVTDEFDEETLHLMSKTRCGMKDVNEVVSSASGEDFTNDIWESQVLYYEVTQYPLYLSSEIVDREVLRAFNMWSKYTNLVFEATEHRADIEISFRRILNTEHEYFQWNDSVIGFSSSPNILGKIYLKYDEFWVTDAYPGSNIFKAVLHQIGHILGLDHNDSKNSIMSPFYQQADKNFELGYDDIQLIQELYGEPRLEYSILCNDPVINDIYTTRDNQYTYIFKDNFYWKMENKTILEGYPKLISDRWPGVEGPIDAAFEVENGWTYIFKGPQLWRYNGIILDDKTPDFITSTFPGAPNYVDAAFSLNKYVYLFSEKSCYLYERNLKEPSGYKIFMQLYSKTLIEAATPLSDGSDVITVFKGDYHKEINLSSFEAYSFEDNEEETNNMNKENTIFFGCNKN